MGRNYDLEVLGCGAGLRQEHITAILEQRPPFRWFEIISENFMGMGGLSKERFDEIRQHYRIVPHGVCLSIGSTDPLDRAYLTRLRAFLREIEAPWTSDHLCFTMLDHTNLNELIPLPFTEEAVENVIERVQMVQDFLECPLLLENVTRYVTVSDREMSEAEFISRICEGSDCGLLLDITNVHLNSQYHEYDAFEFIQSLPLDRVGQMHLAGWEEVPDGAVIDSHDAPVPPEVWELFRKTVELTGPSSVVIEWDSNLPPVGRLLAETRFANELLDSLGSNGNTESKRAHGAS